MQYSIQNEKLSITVDTLGGELVSVCYEGKQRQWQNDNGSWPGHAPLLFPNCGQCHIVVDGKEYLFKAHGFARKSEFTLVEQGADFLTLRLCADENTKACYPFDFIFSVTYRIDGNLLTIEYNVENPADTPLWYSCGAHDSFALPEGMGAYELLFEKDEQFLHCPHTGVGTLTGATEDWGNGKTFALPEAFLSDGKTVIFKQIRSNKLWLQLKNGEKKAEITFDSFDNLLLWRPNSGANMICIEPWKNLPDVDGVLNVEFSQKKGVERVEAKSAHKIVRTIRYY